MKIHLPTKLEVEVDDKDLLSILKMKRMELLDGADYAEQEEDKDVYWLWVDKNATGVGKPNYERMKEMPVVDYQLLESFTNAIYRLQKKLESI